MMANQTGFKQPRYTYRDWKITNNEEGKSYLSSISSITVEEIEASKVLWIKEIQLSLINGNNFANLKSEFNLFYDDNGLLRCGGLPS